LQQNWARTGNIFPYFSRVTPARDRLLKLGFGAWCVEHERGLDVPLSAVRSGR
jgi:hypothetical protein